MLLHTFTNGDELYFYQKSLIVAMKGKRKTLSTAAYNGGYREDLTYVFNNDCKIGAGMGCTLKAPTYGEHMVVLTEELGLDPKTTAGITTAASMENVAIVTETYRNTAVTAVVTGGIEVNGGRVGDPATWDEELGKSIDVPKPGTINIIVSIDANLTEGALTRALVTCTEAKSAAIQELCAPSRYSMGLATGSGTDGTIIFANTESNLTLTNAGKHAKLGELIGKAVKKAVTQALEKQSGLTKKSQHNIIKRVDRFGITSNVFWEDYVKNGGTLSKPEFICRFETLSVDEMVLTFTALYAHLMDQLMWELISPKEAMEAGAKILGIIEQKHSGLEGEKIPFSIEETLQTMIAKYRTTIGKLLQDKESNQCQETEKQ